MKKTREELEAKLDELYKELGKAYYEIGINDPLPELLEQLGEISECRDEITAMAEAEEQRKAFIATQKKIAESICLECDLPVPQGSNFCNHCGKPMPNAEMVAEAVKALAELEEEELSEANVQEEEIQEIALEAPATEEMEETEEVYEELSEEIEPEEIEPAEEIPVEEIPVEEIYAEDPDTTAQLEPEVQEAFKEPEIIEEPFIPEVVSPAPEQRICKNCKHVLLPKHKFCPGCGTPVADC